MKTCCRCKQEKPFSEYYKHAIHRIQQECKSCQNERARVRHAANREASNARVRNAYLKRKYGITSADYEQMLQRQKGVCKICLKPPKKWRLAVDHCHKTGKVRGLLCYQCNHRLLPSGRDNPDIFQSAANYLRDLQ